MTPGKISRRQLSCIAFIAYCIYCHLLGNDEGREGSLSNFFVLGRDAPTNDVSANNTFNLHFC